MGIFKNSLNDTFNDMEIFKKGIENKLNFAKVNVANHPEKISMIIIDFVFQARTLLSETEQKAKLFAASFSEPEKQKSVADFVYKDSENKYVFIMKKLDELKKIILAYSKKNQEIVKKCVPLKLEQIDPKIGDAFYRGLRSELNNFLYILFEMFVSLLLFLIF